ncbi:excalibur calcium-binding domain-containing protein [Arthrobacter sp. RIT-PI-e]|uniref:excalibur calcium-binding domain-containing protein n=1 Tax=Arthrobacter sp. RIT-PI-e TaxID=1681197 RepID=UPI00067602C9|nr:excalibur calcium-binding domain-containing protein [Arthrobacter sp. RIT-PI-e]
MKKSTASITLGAVAGLTLLSASPALAAPIVFQNCTQAANAGVYNIPAGFPGYGTHLDRDLDGIGCENGNFAYNPDLVPDDSAPVPTPAPTVAPGTPVGPQVVQMPMGGAETGIAQKPADNTAALALGAGLVLAATAGGTFVVRRRSAHV